MPPKPRKPTGPLWTILLLAPPATALNPRYRFCAMDVITNCYHRCYHWPITVIQEWSSQLLSHATSGYVATVLGTKESIFWHCAILQLHLLLPESPPPKHHVSVWSLWYGLTFQPLLMTQTSSVLLFDRHLSCTGSYQQSWFSIQDLFWKRSHLHFVSCTCIFFTLPV